MDIIKQKLLDSFNPSPPKMVKFVLVIEEGKLQQLEFGARRLKLSTNEILNKIIDEWRSLYLFP